jgi:vitamin B12 transporter
MRLECLPAIFLGMLLSLLSIHTAFARGQSTATLTGKITDPSDAVITGAKIAAEPLDSAGKPATTQSGQAGDFSLALAPGRYRVSIRHASFARAERQFTLAAGEIRTWNVRLELEKLSSNVVVTAQAQPELAENVAAPVDVITQKDITNRQELWLAPVLTTASGVNMAQEGPYGGITTIFLDGGNSNFTKVLVDGAPANQPGGDIDLEGLDVDNVDKIEVVHGAASALYGSDAMTGVVQIFTHRGTTTTPLLTLESDGGTNDTARGGGQLSGVVGRLDYSASASYFSTSGQGSNDYFRDDARSASLGWKFSDTNRLFLSLRDDANDAGVPASVLEMPAPPSGSHIDQHDFFASLAWDDSLSEHWENHLEGTDSYVRQSIFDAFANATPPPDVVFFDTFDRFYRSGFDERLSYNMPGGIVTLGYEYEVENGEPGGPPHERRNNQGGYFEVDHQLGRRLTVVAGGRVEDNASFGTAVVPRVGLAYMARLGHDFWGATKLRASYGLGIKEPTFIQSFEDDPCFPGNPNLRPERSTTVDVGIDQILDSDRIKFSATYFHNDFQDIVSFSEDFTPTPGCPFGTGTFFNTDKARAFGANSSFEIEVTHWLRVKGNYSYDDTRVLAAPNAALIDPVLTPGHRLIHRPLNSANLDFNATIRRMDWNLAGTYMGRAQDSDFLGLGITSNPSWIRWDLATIFPLGHGLSATARFENLLDRHYQYAVGFPALGFNYRLGLKYTWGGD